MKANDVCKGLVSMRNPYANQSLEPHWRLLRRNGVLLEEWNASISESDQLIP
jgi:hypothetical protein